MKCWILILGMIGLAIPSKGALLVGSDSVGIEKIGGNLYYSPSRSTRDFIWNFATVQYSGK